MPAQPYKLVYTIRFISHLRIVERKYHSLIRETIEELLSYEPTIQARNRKLVHETLLFDQVTWEIRFGLRNRFRVFYETDDEHHIVNILAIGVKDGNRLSIGSEEVQL